MKLKTLIGIFLLASVVACNKKSNDQNPAEKNVTNYFPVTTGSYWIYQTYLIDSLNNENLLDGYDSLSITGDTLINGNEFAVFYGKVIAISSSYQSFFYRDSSGYIVDERGRVVFSQNNLSDTLLKYYVAPDSSLFSFAIMEEWPNTVNSFDSVLNYKLSLVNSAENNTLIGNTNNLYAPNVGRIIKQNFFLHQYTAEKKYYEARLFNYYIAP